MRSFVFLLVVLSSLFVYAQPSYKTCDQDQERLKARSSELQKIVAEDQSDRTTDPEHINWEIVLPRDEARRERVGEIFGEGCFSTAEDYAAAALVYQHGNIPDHFFQTYIWAKRAVDLGDLKSRWLMAAGIDRYLMNIGHKQLFATQAITENDCWCLQQVEETFPADRRVEYGKRSISEALQWIGSMNAQKPQCASIKYCAKPLLDSPVGTVPGFW